MIVDKIHSLESIFSLAHCVSYGTKNPLQIGGDFFVDKLTSFPYHPFLPYHHP